LVRLLEIATIGVIENLSSHTEANASGVLKILLDFHDFAQAVPIRSLLLN